MRTPLAFAPFGLIAGIALLLGVAGCGMIRGYPAPVSERNTADLGMAPYAGFGNSATSPGGADASAASSTTLPRGPGISNYNGPNTPPDPPPPRPTTG